VPDHAGVVGRDERELPDVVLRRADPLRECRDLRAVVTEGGANDRRDLRLVLGTLRAEDHAWRLNRSTYPAIRGSTTSMRLG
jgi:hypothetical protein